MRTRAASARATSREVITTDAPSSTNAFAMASPMPIDPPVMTAIFPFIRIFIRVFIRTMVLVVPARRRRQARLRHMRLLALGPQYNCKNEPSAFIPTGSGFVPRRAAAAAYLRASLQRNDWGMPGAQRAVWRGTGARDRPGRRGMHG